jgi:hypothetical protein
MAANDFLLRFTGAKVAPQAGYLTVDARLARLVVETPRRDDHCPECGHGPSSRASRADSVPLPVRVARRRPGFSLMAGRLLRE